MSPYPLLGHTAERSFTIKYTATKRRGRKSQIFNGIFHSRSYFENNFNGEAATMRPAFKCRLLYSIGSQQFDSVALFEVIPPGSGYLLAVVVYMDRSYCFLIICVCMKMMHKITLPEG